MAQDIKNQKIDLSEILSTYKRRWWWFAISIIFCIGLSAAYIYIKRPVFNLTAKLLVTSDDSNGGMGGSIMKNLSFLGQGSTVSDDEIQILNSHTILTHAIKNLNLNISYDNKTSLLRKHHYYNDAPIKLLIPEQVLDTLSIPLNFSIKIDDKGNTKIKLMKNFFVTYLNESNITLPTNVKTPFGIFNIIKTKYYVPGEEYNIKVRVYPYTELAEKYMENISIYSATKKANSLVFNMESTNVKQDKDLLNEIMSLYNARGVEVKNEIANKTKKFINDRLDILYGDLSLSENNIEIFKKDNNFVDLKAEAQYQMGLKGTFEAGLFQTETKLSIANMIKDFLNNPSNNLSLIPFTTEGDGTIDAIAEYNSLVLEYIKLSNNAKADNAVIKAIVKQIGAVRKNVIESINKSIESNQIRLSELSNGNNKSASKLKNIPSQEKEFIDLQRKQSVQNYLYSFLLQKKEENELVLAAAIPKGQIIDNAYSSSEPVAPKKIIVIAIGFIFGILMPIIIMYISELFKTKFTTIDELSKLTNTPIIGEICHSKNKSKIVVRNGKKSPLVELFRLIRNNLQFLLPENKNSVILVTSSISGEGKSFISSNVAASISLLENKKVILLGMDIRSPQLANYLDIPQAPGLTNYLASQNSLNDIIQRTHLADLDVIVAGPIPPNPSELLLSNKVKTLIDDLKERYDYIIIDSAPISLVSDTFSLTKYADVTLFVTRASYTKRHLIKYFNQVTANNQLKNPTIILNDTNSKLSHGYGYGYGIDLEDDEE